MNCIFKLGLFMLALPIMGSTISQPAYAQVDGQYIGPGQMQQFVPVLQKMKQTLGNKRFRELMHAMGPEMSQMMDNPDSFNGGGYGGYMGTPTEQFAPLIEMMKQKLGKRRFAQLMQSLGPTMSQTMGYQGAGVTDPGSMAGAPQMPNTSGNQRKNRLKQARPPQQ